MTTGEVITAICGALGGGVLVEVYHYIRSRGKVVVDSYYANVSYVITELNQKQIRGIEVEIQFINRSGHNKVLNKFKVEYFDFQSYVNLNIEGSNVPPAIVIEPTNPKVLKMKLYSNGILDVNIGLNYCLEISYNVGKKQEKLIIWSTEFNLQDVTKPFTMLF